ncbi:EGF-like repeat and discoidin I-like domain-containing protein 3 [Ciona intestinalis]
MKEKDMCVPQLLQCGGGSGGGGGCGGSGGSGGAGSGGSGSGGGGSISISSGVTWTPSDAPVVGVIPVNDSPDSCNCEPTEPVTEVFENNDTTWAEDACRAALGPMMNNPLCRDGMGDQQDVFMQSCMNDVITYNDTNMAKVAADAYIGICRFTLNLPDPCISNPCQNEGVCNNEDGTTYNCTCPCGWNGTNCEIQIDECTVNLCQNGAECVDEQCGYHCVCTAGYAGFFCQTPCMEPLGLNCDIQAIHDDQICASSEMPFGRIWYMAWAAKEARLQHWVVSIAETSTYKYSRVGKMVHLFILFSHLK